MKLIYPAILYPFDDDNGYTIEVPDLPGCVSEGDSMADAILMGIDAAAGWVLDELEDGHPVPAASDASALRPVAGRIVTLLVLDMDAYAEKYGNRAVRKNISIPAYMNTYVERHGLSLSQLVQDVISGRMLHEA